MKLAHLKPYLMIAGVLAILAGFSAVTTNFARAEEASQEAEQTDPNKEAELDAKKRKIEELQAKLREISGQKVSLSTTIEYISTKINLSQAEIDKTQAELNLLEAELADLTTRIGGLEQSLDVLSGILLDRVATSYKQQQSTSPQMLLLTNSLSDYYVKTKYLKISEEKTRELMAQAENQKHLFDQQKTLKELKQQEVAAKKVQLDRQRTELASERQAQQQLLTETKNNEAKYQAELQKTLAEIQAIQGIIAGKGNEVEVRKVTKGETIASIIVGASPCSTGSHLHFEVVKSGVHQNPASYLSSIDASWNNSPDGAFGFGGGWDWPVNNPAKINQGYGMTYYASVRRAYGGAPHTGIDMASKSSDYTVKAVRDGVLYRGGISCGGRSLQYVRVVHFEDPSISTYYLHVNY